VNIWVILFIVMSVIFLAIPFITVSKREINGMGKVEEESGAGSIGTILLDLEQLDLDLATGKLTPEDHDQMRNRLRQELSEIDHEGVQETGEADGALS
jgi:hypothetical protein